MDMPLAAAAIVIFALTAYIALDGFDLGVGALLLLRSDEAERDQMVAAIAPTWDGNETWLILAGVGLLACFPTAYSALLPALYLPVILMLMCLGFRGVSFEFRFQTIAWRRFWDRAFAWGSIAAAFCQGVALAGAVQGVTMSGTRFAGGSLDFLSPFAMIAGAAVLAAYAALGSAWLIGKAAEPVQLFARRTLGVSCGCLAVLATAVFAGAVIVQPGIGEAWARQGDLLLTLGFLFYLGLAIAPTFAARRSGTAALGTLVAGYLCVLVGLVVCLNGTVVPFRLSIAQAASPTASVSFFVVGGLVVIPVILAYTALSYRIFKGRATAPAPDQ